MHMVPALQYNSKDGKQYVLSQIDDHTGKCNHGKCTWSNDQRNNFVSGYMNSNPLSGIDYSTWELWLLLVRDALVSQDRFEYRQLTIIDVDR